MILIAFGVGVVVLCMTPLLVAVHSWERQTEEYEREMNKVTKEFFGEEWCD